MPKSNPITRALIAAMAHSAQPMVLTDPRQPDHPMIAVNPAFEALTLYPTADTVGRNCRFLQGAETDPETPRRIGRCIAEKRGCIEWVLNYRRDGTKFWNLLFISPIFDADGGLLHFFGNQRDITLGPPADIADYSLGKADMPLQGQAEFDALVRAMIDESGGEADRAESLERMIEQTRRLNDVTTRLVPTPWTPGGPPPTR
jgi:PAS domain S-box-containing protein